jgi:hypothetical protein
MVEILTNLFLKLYSNLFSEINKFLLVVIFLISGIHQNFCQKAISVKMTGFSELGSEIPSFIYLYEILEGVEGVKKFVDIISVSSQGEFTFLEPEEYTRVYEFESPPWSWKVLVRPDGLEKDSLYLIKPNVGVRRLRGNSARAVWGDGHPLFQYDSLILLASKLDRLVLYDRMILSGSVGGARSSADTVFIDSINQVFEKACFQLLSSEDFRQEPYYADLVRSRLWQWRRDSGWGSERLKEMWCEEMEFDTSRSKVEKARSPGWCSSWIDVHGEWIEGVENLDSIDMEMNELDFAMWWRDIIEPHSTASIWWDKNPDSSLAELRALRNIEPWNKNDLLKNVWTTPSLDLVPFDELEGYWSVILVVKNGSGSSLKEWGAFRAVENSLKTNRKNLQFVVLCIDGTQKEWESLLSKRISISETLRWVGADCRWLDGFEINSIPQTIIITPSLQIYSNSSLRPSHGLGSLLYKITK